MRGSYRSRRAEEEEESAFISMTDMTVSFLFIIMILLAYFATQITKTGSDAKAAISKQAALTQEVEKLRRLLAAKENNPIEKYNFNAAEARGKLLERIKKRISEIDKSIDVSISKNRDALEFKGDGLFASGSEIPTTIGRHKMELISSVLKEELRCYSLGDQSLLASGCNPKIAMIDALQVEGHTDNTGNDALNMELSSRRGSSVYGILSTTAPELLTFKNLKDQPILSVAGYGKGRPIRGNETEQGKDSNRRIDLRFIMFSPTVESFIPYRLEDLPKLKEILTSETAN